MVETATSVGGWAGFLATHAAEVLCWSAAILAVGLAADALLTVAKRMMGWERIRRPETLAVQRELVGEGVGEGAGERAGERVDERVGKSVDTCV